ncbi:AAA family ATPase [Nitrosomonas sp.]|uniref:AAA family ATPase n=1 Tax=Nitrosomonas sp. TaxID=42353 RepID=UPI0025D4EC4E|nr:AAA family ATPase [Nitrosomonas sp.]
MKIEQISAHNIIAARSADIQLSNPVNMICGSNEAGKSSIYEAIIHAFTGASTRVGKKELKHLVNDNDTVGYCYVEWDGGKRASITLPNGAHEIKEQIHSALPYVLNPALFSSATEDLRRGLIIEITGTKRDLPSIKKKMLERKCNEKKTESILPFLVSGFSNAQKQAIDNTKDARSSWKATTGEVYGDKKAVDWKAVKPEVDQSAMAAAQKALEDISAEFDAENQKLGSLQTQFNNANKNEAEINGLRAKSGQIDRIETKLSIDKKELALITVKVEDARRLAQGSTPDNIACKCPSCDSDLFWNGKELVKREGDLQGNEDAVLALPGLESALTLLKNSVENGERDLAAAKYAKEKLVELEKESKEVISEERINLLKEKLDSLRTKRKESQDALDLINKNVKLALEADEKTKKAAGYHTDVQEWDAISYALAPDGIPGEILKTAITPINERLAKTSTDTGWKQVFINDDMTISYGGKPYGLASQSAKWRANVMIAEAISHITELKFFMADEFDLLDPPSRVTCMKWLVTLAKNKEIETVMVFGTLKELPEKLPSLTSAYWIQDGVIAQDNKAKAA